MGEAYLSHQAYLFNLVQGCHRNIPLWILAYHPKHLVAVTAGRVDASLCIFQLGVFRFVLNCRRDSSLSSVWMKHHKLGQRAMDVQDG